MMKFKKRDRDGQVSMEDSIVLWVEVYTVVKRESPGEVPQHVGKCRKGRDLYLDDEKINTKRVAGLEKKQVQRCRWDLFGDCFESQGKKLIYFRRILESNCIDVCAKVKYKKVFRGCRQSKMVEWKSPPVIPTPQFLQGHQLNNCLYRRNTS